MMGEEEERAQGLQTKADHSLSTSPEDAAFLNRVLSGL